MTPRQQQALDLIRAKQRVVTLGPTIRELAEALGVSVNGAQQKIGALRKAGLVAPDSGRGLVLTSSAADEESPVIQWIPKREILAQRGRQPILKPSAKTL